MYNKNDCLNKPCIVKTTWFTLLIVLLLGWMNSVYALSVTRGPYLQSGSSDSVIIRWRTDTTSNSQVNYGSSVGNLVQSETELATGTEHEVKITGLTPDSRYYYSFGSTSEVIAGDSAEYFFDTSPTTGFSDSTRIWVLGDSGTANSNASAVRDAFYGFPLPEADLILMLGDNAYNDGTDAQYQSAVFDMYPDILKNTVLWSTLGNHDGYSADSSTETGPYYDIFSFPRNGEVGGVASGTEAYYSFDYANIHFICLDSYDTNRSTSGAMYTWLLNDLGAHTQEWTVAFWHHPPYTKGSHDSDSESALVDMRTSFLPLLESYGVDLVLSGHSHSYERSYLLNGHYGVSSTLNPSTMILDNGNGQEFEDGAYDKSGSISDGTVYITAGSSGKTSSGSLNHPAMHISLQNLGSVVLDVNGSRMDVTFLRENSSTPDQFTIIKGPDLTAPVVVGAEATAASIVEVSFNEAIEQTSAENTANFFVDKGIDVNSSTLLGDGETVQLSVDTLTPGVNYSVTVTEVEDISGNMISTTGEVASFVYVVLAEFQNGVLPDTGYSGNEDAYIAQVAPTSNYGSSTSLLVDGDNGGGVDLASLVRWDISAIPAGSTIDSAEISFNVFDSSTQQYSLYALQRDWNEAQVTWNQAASGVLWDFPGAQGASDRDSTPLGILAAPSTGEVKIALNPDGINAVQNWVDNPGLNHGLIIASSSNANGVDISSSESTAQDRPKLSITYLPVDDTEAPSIPDNVREGSTSTNSIEVLWDASTDNVAIAGYEISRDGQSPQSVTGTSFLDTGLGAGTPYGYQVLAIDTSGNRSAYTSTVSISTDVPPAETINVIEAAYYSGRDELRIRATSSEQPSVSLEVVGFAPMIYKGGKYEYKLKPVGNIPVPQYVDILSSLGTLVTVPVAGAPTPSLPDKTHSPNPANGATSVVVDATLSWAAGANTDDYNVYFGTDPIPPFQAYQPTTVYDPGLLSEGTTYYWRIDAVNNQGVTTGDSWSFTTAASPTLPEQASNPSPATGSSNVDLNMLLTWTAGSQANFHNVFFGTDPSPPEVSIGQSGASWNPGTLSSLTNYHWRVDEVNAQGITPGAVWTFTTGNAVSNDTVTITKAEWRLKRKKLIVEATSNASPGAVLNLIGFGDMNYNVNKNIYTYQQNSVNNSPVTVQVDSSLGGSDTRAVVTRN